MLSTARNHNNRGRGRGGWNGRAGGQRYGGNGSTASKKKDEKKLLKFHPLVKGKHPDSSFDEVKKELVLNLEGSDLEKADDIIDCVRFQSRIDSMNANYMVVHQDYGQRMTYPTTVHHTTKTMNRHKADNRKSKNVSRNRNSNHESSHGNSGNLAQTGNSSSRACYVCGGRDHVAPSCNDRFKPKSEWWKPDKYKNYSHLQTETESNNRSNLQTGSNNGGSNTDGGTGSSQGRSNVQWSFAQYQRQYYGQSIDQDEFNDVDFKKQMDEGISADSGSNFHLYKPEHVKEGTIRKLKQKFSYGSNTGSREDLTNEGESKIIPECKGKIDPKAAHSVVGLSKLHDDGWDILMDTRRWNGITVHKDGQVIRFPQRNGLYTWMPEEQPKYGEPAWIDELGSKLLFDQFNLIQSYCLNTLIEYRHLVN